MKIVVLDADTLGEDLNLISSLEYDMQPTDRKPVRLCPLIRETVSDILNSGLAAAHEVTFDNFSEFQ